MLTSIISLLDRISRALESTRGGILSLILPLFILFVKTIYCIILVVACVVLVIALLFFVVVVPMMIVDSYFKSQERKKAKADMGRKTEDGQASTDEQGSGKV